MLENTKVFSSDDDIVDTLFDVFCTGQLTSQYAMITALTHLTQQPESKKKIKDFYQKIVQDAILANPNIANLSRSEKLKELVTFETIDGFEWLSHVF